MNIPVIHFEQATLNHKETIFQWLDKPHVMEFWDNSQKHRDDILDFMNGRKGPSPYFGGIMTYWVGMIDKSPFCFLLTSEFIPTEKGLELWNEHCSKNGKTFTIDFYIGDEAYLGKGLASVTLEAFMDFFRKKVNKEADTFFIDPSENNPKAQHVYEKAGFKPVGEFTMKQGFFTGLKSLLMVKYISPFDSNDQSSYQWEIKNFNQLTKHELYAILRFRMEIFILEQQSIYLDLDNMDQRAIHFLGMDRQQLIAYGRVTFNELQKFAEIRRIAIHKDYRQQQLGTILIKKMLGFISSQPNVMTIELDAQHHLKDFYGKHGFKIAGLPYDDGGILHIKMHKTLND